MDEVKGLHMIYRTPELRSYLLLTIDIRVLFVNILYVLFIESVIRAYCSLCLPYSP